MKKMIAVIGLGKAGLPLASVIANSGFKVIGVDVDKSKCEAINKGINPIPEESELNELIKKHGGKNLIATVRYEDARNCKVYIIIVPLYINKSYEPDFRILENAIKQVGRILKKEDLVVIETTLPVGTTESIVKDWLERESGLKLGQFYLAYSPERIMTGYSLSRLKEFPKIIGGVDKKSGEIAYNFYSKFIPNLHLVSSARVAEFIKIIEGCYRDVNIALANELYKIANELDIDFYEARKYANHKYCHIHLPSTGVGGHCFYKNESVFIFKNGDFNHHTFKEFYNLVSGEVLVFKDCKIKVPDREYRVLSFDPTKMQSRVEKVLLLSKRKIRSEKLLKIYLENGIKLTITENHLALVYENGELQQKIAKNLKIGEKFIFLKNIEKMYVSNSKRLLNMNKKVYGVSHIEKIKGHSYDRYVYSIEVNKTGTIVTTEGVVVHNCIPVYPWFLIKSMEKLEKFDYVRLLRTAREINDEMVYYWAEKILSECSKIKKPLKDVKICVKGITFREGVRETYHSRNLKLARVLKSKGLNVGVYDELLGKGEVKKLKLNWMDPKDADVVFDSFSLKIEISKN